MTMPENRFNLIDEPWIPVVDVGRVSLRQLFSQPHYRALGGNPVQKIALTKLLLAIAQSACTPADDQEWTDLQPAGLAEKCLAYLDQWHDRFFLYGDQPFLQMPAIKAATIQPFGAVLPEVSTGNTTVLTQGQIERPMTNADKALLVVQLMGFGLGGKKTDNSVVLTSGYQAKFNDNGKPSTGKPGVSIGFLGFLHNFLQGDSLQETLWLNLFTDDQVAMLNIYPRGAGIAPWEHMPIGEKCARAEDLTSSLIGRLLPLSRFCLLADDGVHYSEGVSHAGYKEGVADPSVSVDFSSNAPKAIWVDPEKRPWRVLTALLSFFSQNSSSKFDCHQLRLCMLRAMRCMQTIGIWSGGLRVSSNAGEQYVAGSDDFVESMIQLNSATLGELWFANLQLEMDELEKLSKIVYSASFSYFKSQQMENKGQAAQAGNLFWQLCERRFQELVLACASPEQAFAMRPIFARFVNKAYDTYCPRDSARQLDAWAKNRPNLGKYLKNLNKEEAA
jgi:CRISPR system Cascade subunit CasA